MSFILIIVYLILNLHDLFVTFFFFIVSTKSCENAENDMEYTKDSLGFRYKPPLPGKYVTIYFGCYFI